MTRFTKGLRRRLSYANVIATLAFFFALTGASMAGVKYLANGDPAGGVLAGTYPSPTFASNATAPNAGKLGGQDVVIVSRTFSVPGGNEPSDEGITCPSDRIAVHFFTTDKGPDVFVDSGVFNFGRSSYDTVAFNSSQAEESVTLNLACFGS
jgi:hypothetical protein